MKRLGKVFGLGLAFAAVVYGANKLFAPKEGQKKSKPSDWETKIWD